jgi:hypothetical protein
MFTAPIPQSLRGSWIRPPIRTTKRPSKRRIRLAIDELEPRIQPVDLHALTMYNDLSQSQFSLASDPTGNAFVNEYEVDLVTDMLNPFIQDFQVNNPFQPLNAFLTTPLPGISIILSALGQPTTLAQYLPSYFQFVISPQSFLNDGIDSAQMDGFGFPDFTALQTKVHQGTITQSDITQALNDLNGPGVRGGANPIVTYGFNYSPSPVTLFDTNDITGGPLPIPGLSASVGIATIGLTVKGTLSAGITANLKVGRDSQGFFLDRAATNPIFTASLTTTMTLAASVDADGLGSVDAAKANFTLIGTVGLNLAPNPHDSSNYYGLQDLSSVSLGDTSGSLTFEINVPDPFPPASGGSPEQDVLGGLEDVVTLGAAATVPDPIYDNTWTLWNTDASSENQAAAASQTVVTVSDSPAVNEGTPFTISAQINGSSTIPSGDTVVWKQIGGPRQNIVIPNALSTPVDQSGDPVGVQSFVVTVTDANNNVFQKTVQVTVNNVSPYDVQIGGRAPSMTQGGALMDELPLAAENIPDNIPLSFVDPGIPNTDILFNLTQETYYEDMQYGDGSDTGLQQVEVSAFVGPAPHNRFHTYAQPGTYTITYYVEDNHDLAAGITPQMYYASITVVPAILDSQGNLDIGGTKGDDAIVLSSIGNGNVVVTVNNVPAGVFLPTGHVLVYTAEGNDTVTIGTRLAVPVYVAGGGGNDELVAPQESNTWNITGSNEGQINNSVFFINMQNLVGGGNLDHFIFLPGTAPSPDGSVSGKIDGGGGTATLDFSALSDASVILTGLGASTGLDGVTSGTVPIGGTFENITSIVGSTTSTTDSLNGLNTNSVWNIDSGTSTYQDISSGRQLSFSNFPNLGGGSGTDDFVFANRGSIAGNLSGGPGANTLDETALANSTVTIRAKGTDVGAQGKATDITGTFDDITNLVGFTTLGAPDAPNVWNITGLDIGTLTTFGVSTNFHVANLLGGSMSDSFKFQNGGSVDSVNGAGGTNTLDYLAYTAPVTLNLQNLTATGTGSFANINALIGGMASSTLVGANTSNTWNIIGGNAGNINGTFSFTAIQNLTGGSGDDDFKFANGAGITGTLDGGAGGTNTLDYSAYTTPVFVNLQNFAASGMAGFANINSLIGGSAAGTLIGANVTNTWVVAPNNEGTLNGTFSFASITNLIGGTGTDTFTVNTSKSSNSHFTIDGGGQTGDTFNATDVTGVGVMTDHPTGPFSGTLVTDYLAGASSSVDYRNIKSIVKNIDPDSSFVQSLYHTLLGRDGAAAEIASWNTVMHSGAPAFATRQAVAASFLQSSEYCSDVVVGTYRRLLGRAADPAGLSSFVNALQAGRTVLELEAVIMGSDEYFASRGNSSNAGFLQAVYLDVLNRAPDASGLQSYSSLLASGSSRQSVAAIVFASGESAGLRATEVYANTLHRAPDPGGLAAATASLANGLTDTQLAGVFVTSTEYAANDGGDANQVFVAQVYRDLLGREADPGGLETFTRQLDLGVLSRAKAVDFIQHSPEYYSVVVTGLYQEVLGRAPDASGLASTTVFLSSHTALETRSELTSSDEYFSNRGQSNNTGFLQAFYEDALGRSPDAGGAQAYSALLASGVSRGTVAELVFASSESADRRASALYQMYLHRDADLGGHASASARLQGGMSDEHVAAILMASAEYFSRI